MRCWKAIAVVAAVLVMPVLTACSQPDAVKADRVIDTSPDDAAMNAAKKRATETLVQFWTKFDGQAQGVTHYVVKLGLTGQDGFVEFIWAEPVRREGDQVVARLANEPEHLRPLRLGSEVRVSQRLIADWGYQKDGQMYGHFTTRVLLPKMPSEERAQVELLLAPTPLEPNAS